MALLRYRVFLTGLVVGGGVSNFHFDAAQPPIAPTDVVDAVEAAYTIWRNLIAIGTNMTGDDHVDVINPATGDVTESVGLVGFNLAGLAAGDALPKATQGLVEMRTGVRVGGREVRGRLFMPNPVETSNASNGSPVADYYNGLVSGTVPLMDADLGWCVYSRTHHITPHVASVAGWTKWASLRSRRD